MNNKTLLYIGIAAAAYYLYTKSQKPFEFTSDELQKINAIAKGNPIAFAKAIKTVLTPARYAEFVESENKKKMAQ
jgi:hypothetical protein